MDFDWVALSHELLATVNSYADGPYLWGAIVCQGLGAAYCFYCRHALVSEIEWLHPSLDTVRRRLRSSGGLASHAYVNVGGNVILASSYSSSSAAARAQRLKHLEHQQELMNRNHPHPHHQGGRTQVMTPAAASIGTASSALPSSAVSVPAAAAPVIEAKEPLPHERSGRLTAQEGHSHNHSHHHDHRQNDNTSNNTGATPSERSRGSSSRGTAAAEGLTPLVLGVGRHHSCAVVHTKIERLVAGEEAAETIVDLWRCLPFKIVDPRGGEAVVSPIGLIVSDLLLVDSQVVSKAQGQALLEELVEKLTKLKDKADAALDACADTFADRRTMGGEVEERREVAVNVTGFLEGVDQLDAAIDSIAWETNRVRTTGDMTYRLTEYILPLKHMVFVSSDAAFNGKKDLVLRAPNDERPFILRLHPEGSEEWRSYRSMNAEARRWNAVGALLLATTLVTVAVPLLKYFLHWAQGRRSTSSSS